MKLNYLLSILLISILITSLSGCSNMPGGGDPSVTGPNGKYYTGKTGVTANYENLPNKVYYYEEDIDNGFDFGVKVKNEGTSFARGATFISGYDPNFIQIQGLEIQESNGWGDCTLDLTSFGTNPSSWIGNIGCALSNGGGFDVNTRNGNIGFNIENLGLLFDRVGINLPGFTDVLSVGFNENPDGSISLDFDLDLQNLDISVMYHGTGLLIAMTPMIFETYLGKSYELEPDNHYYPGGGQDFLEYHANIDSWPPGLDEYPVTLLLTNCYGYVTYASPLMCIDPRPMSEQTKVCRAKTITMSSQGAPVAVTKVEQENTAKKAIFTIYVKNVGGGEIINWGQLERCSPYFPGDLQSKHKNVLQAFNVRIEDTLLECNANGGIFRLDENGEGSIMCTYELEYTNLQTAYTTPLIVEFWYGYQETESKNIMFKKV